MIKQKRSWLEELHVETLAWQWWFMLDYSTLGDLHLDLWTDSPENNGKVDSVDHGICVMECLWDFCNLEAQGKQLWCGTTALSSYIEKDEIHLCCSWLAPSQLCRLEPGLYTAPPIHLDMPEPHGIVHRASESTGEGEALSSTSSSCWKTGSTA